MLGIGVRVAPTMQFELLPKDEGILVVVLTLDLIEEMVELQCRAAVVSRAISDRLKRAESVVIPKLRNRLDDSATSLRKALQAVDDCQKEKEKDNQLAKEEQETLKATLATVMAERDLLKKEKVDLTVEKESLSAEIEQCQDFMLRVSEEKFNQGVRQIAFFHGVLVEDTRYDSGMDVVDGQLVLLEGEDAEEADQILEDPAAETPQQDETIEIV